MNAGIVQCGALFDSGASLCFISNNYIEVLLAQSKGQVQIFEHDLPFIVTLAVDQLSTRLKTAIIRMRLCNKIFIIHKFIILPELSEQIIIGSQFLIRYRSSIRYRDKTLHMLLDDGSKIFIPLVFNNRTHYDLSIVRSLSMNVELSNFLKELPLPKATPIADLCTTFMQLSDSFAHIIEALHGKIHSAVLLGVISTEEANVAFSELMPLIHYFSLNQVNVIIVA